MTKQTINTVYPDNYIGVGAAPNDKQGDSLRNAFTKINNAVNKIDANFTELYADTYTPTTTSDWNGTAPTTVTEALDRLATAVKALNGTGA